MIGIDARLPAPNAAFANAMLCHGLDFDDTHSDSVAHVSTVVVPAAVALAEAAGVWARAADGDHRRQRDGDPDRDGDAGRVPRTRLPPHRDLRRSSARRRRRRGSPAWTRRRRRARSGIVGSMASGLFAYLDDGTATKPIHPAWAAHGALLAARLAALGAEGPPSVLEGSFGLFHAFVDTRIDLEPQLADLGSSVGDAADRLQGVPRLPLHPRLARRDRRRSCDGLDPDEIEDVVVTVPEAGVSLVLEPAELKIAPRSEYEGKFSLQYSTAAMLVHGRVGLTAYTAEAIARPAVLDAGAEGALRDEGVPVVPGGVPRRRAHRAARTGRRSRPTSRTRRARPRTR